MALRTASAMVLAAVALSGGATGSALAFTVTDTATLGSAASATASCDTDGVHLGDWTTTHTAAGSTLTGAVLDDLSPACAGKTARVTLTAADGSALATAQFEVTGASTAFTFGAVPVATLHSTAVTISS